jgi:hypothetical protein
MFWFKLLFLACLLHLSTLRGVKAGLEPLTYSLGAEAVFSIYIYMQQLQVLMFKEILASPALTSLLSIKQGWCLLANWKRQLSIFFERTQCCWIVLLPGIWFISNFCFLQLVERSKTLGSKQSDDTQHWHSGEPQHHNIQDSRKIIFVTKRMVENTSSSFLTDDAFHDAPPPNQRHESM